jgi:two-component system, chemotaxis family, sensor kinase CheA
MGFEADEEIMQDFLVEAGEILEHLSEQLVDLENQPNDADLLNAIFRGFHTVKGGAGFLSLNTLVDCCHEAENVFDILRNGQRAVTSDLMDVVLEALDSVNEMFEAIKAGETPTPADKSLLERLHALASPESEDKVEVVAEVEPEPVVVPVENTSEESITDNDFEQLLDAIAPAAGAEIENSNAEVGGAEVDLFDLGDSPVEDTDEISEDEFEALLDQLHGKGQFSNSEVEEKKAVVAPADKKKDTESDEISDSEFEALLDELHGKGQFSTADEKPTVAAKNESAPKVNESDEISDSEFENLLDELHGKDQFGGALVEEKAVTKAAPEPVIEKVIKAPKVVPKKVAVSEPATKVVEKAVVKDKGAAKEKPLATAQEATVRVDTKRLDDIMNMVGELVLVRNRLVRLGAQHSDEVLQKAVGSLDVVTTDLQNSVMKTRMQPIKKVFGRFPRVVRDLARNLKKEINLELIGEETDLDKNLVEALADPLVHLVRNAVDHGVETPDEREKNGKSRQGKVVLSAQQEGDHILLSITDDGGGMDPEVLRQKSVEKGLFDQDSADRLSRKECFNLIFMPGFSTKVEISDVSGRGVGMDVVKTKISQLNGTIDIESDINKGTSISIKVPLTLAIMPTLMVMLSDQAFALPLVNVNEIFHLDLSKTNVVDGKEVVIVRGKTLPLFYLKRWLIKDQFGDVTASDSAHVVVVSVGTQRVGFVVDQLVGQEEVVIKPLGKMLQGTGGMAGATITGDGRIALILDVPSMLKRYA